MKSTDIELDAHLKGLLKRLRKVSPLDSEAVAEEREKFLSQGEVYRLSVSQQPGQSQKGWMDKLVPAFQRKQRMPILNALVAIILALAVLFGVAGATVYAAQGSLPDEILYPVKTWSEDARLTLASSSQVQLNLALDFTDRRMAEIASLMAASKTVPEGVAARFQNELDDLLQIAAGMDDPQMMQALSQIRQQAESQSQAMSAWIGDGSGQSDPLLERLQERLQEQVRLAETGGADPQGFRLQVQQRLLIRQKQPTQTPGAAQLPTGSSFGPGSGEGSATGTPGSYAPGGTQPSRTPLPTGSSYGPGPGLSSATPGGYGPGSTAGSPTRTPAPSGGGPGDGSKPSQTTQTGGSGPGTNPSQTPQPGGPGPGSNPNQTSQPGGRGSGSPDPESTPQPGGTGSGNGGSIATSHR